MGITLGESGEITDVIVTPALVKVGHRKEERPEYNTFVHV